MVTTLSKHYAVELTRFVWDIYLYPIFIQYIGACPSPYAGFWSTTDLMRRRKLLEGSALSTRSLSQKKHLIKRLARLKRWRKTRLTTRVTQLLIFSDRVCWENDLRFWWWFGRYSYIGVIATIFPSFDVYVFAFYISWLSMAHILF